jgi:hypothetical protein
VQTLTEKLLIYALGRGAAPYDLAAVRRSVRDAADEDYRFSSFSRRGRKHTFHELPLLEHLTVVSSRR